MTTGTAAIPVVIAAQEVSVYHALYVGCRCTATRLWIIAMRSASWGIDEKLTGSEAELESASRGIARQNQLDSSGFALRSGSAGG